MKNQFRNFWSWIYSWPLKAICFLSGVSLWGESCVFSRADVHRVLNPEWKWKLTQETRTWLLHHEILELYKTGCRMMIKKKTGQNLSSIWQLLSHHFCWIANQFWRKKLLHQNLNKESDIMQQQLSFCSQREEVSTHCIPGYTPSWADPPPQADTPRFLIFFVFIGLS